MQKHCWGDKAKTNEMARTRPNRIPKVALHWTPLGKRKRGRAKQHGGQLHQSWRKWVLLWARLSTLQWGRGRWRQIVDFLSGMKKIRKLVILEFETDSVI